MKISSDISNLLECSKYLLYSTSFSVVSSFFTLFTKIIFLKCLIKSIIILCGVLPFFTKFLKVSIVSFFDEFKIDFESSNNIFRFTSPKHSLISSIVIFSFPVATTWSKRLKASLIAPEESSEIKLIPSSSISTFRLFKT